MSESKATAKILELTSMGAGRQLLQAVSDLLDEEILNERYQAVDHNNFDETKGRIRGLEGFKGLLNKFFDTTKARTK
jgi:hypothetical protein